MQKPVLFIITLLVTLSLYAGDKTYSVTSPDGNLHFSLQCTSEQITYTVTYRKNKIVDNSAIRLIFPDDAFASHLKMNKPVFSVIDTSYTLVVGKSKIAHDHCRQMVIGLSQTQAPFHSINFIVRAYDEGIAFRYEFPTQTNWKTLKLTDEHTEMNIAGNPKVITGLLENFQTSHEPLYTHLRYADIKNDTLMDVPALFQFDNGVHMAITEAALRNYAGMYLIKEKGILRTALSPHIDDPDIKVEATLPHHSPWRVFLISDRMGDLFTSNMITNLNEPCVLKDISWIRPGKTTFPWWNGNIVPDTNFCPGSNFETHKYYIDFAAANHIQYHDIYGYGQQPWYFDDGSDFGQPGSEADATKPVASLDMKHICDYAHSKGVGIHLWVNWKVLYKQHPVDSIFALYEQWGVSGMMVDFIDRDDQQMIQMQEEILKTAAKHHLFIQFHGVCKPTGLSRTYPNEFTREGTLNYENYKWSSDVMNANHDLDVAFTRLIAGATDYHLGGFRSLPQGKHIIHFTNPYVTGTRAHMLAMYVVMESALQMVADAPEAYRDAPGFEFLQEVPVTWDSTVTLHAEVGEYITIARRKNNEWYVGTLNNTKARDVSIPLSFLGNGNYEMTVYEDAADSDAEPNHLQKRIESVTAKDVINIHVAGSGGAVMQIKASGQAVH
ncbi:glycoside hydrolase family 97 protein [Danxiaibacter flavus]|uniref:Glycoside hydrolase family 97 protein n=1 Tax=Danxiaibacter flavus TaxID=3049108 RepID=A0ABV3ZIF2_9BACT|nr:glycoside hydrolase family 97 protein [Chitinophagaceae bacterium DXS]